MKIAVIGSGISGLSLAYLLDKKYDVTLFEENNYVGGHANTALIKYQDKEIAVDTGFIVFNFKTYPNLKAFFNLLKVKIEKSNMSFGVRNLDNNFEYSGNNLAGIFAQKRNRLKPKFQQDCHQPPRQSKTDLVDSMQRQSVVGVLPVHVCSMRDIVGLCHH